MSFVRWMATAAILACAAAEAAPRPLTRGAEAGRRFEGWTGVEPRRWPAAPPLAAEEAPSCLAGLSREGVDAVAAPPSAAPIVECAVADAVRLRVVAAAHGPVRIAGEPVVACAFAIRFGAFVRELAAPLAQGGAGAALVAIEAGGGYECRPRNRVAGAKLSAHGKGLALDIAAFRLGDGRRIAVGATTGAREQRYLAGLRAAACGYFHTVLGPGSDAAHGDHLHVDLEPRGARGDSRFCQ